MYKKANSNLPLSVRFILAGSVTMIGLAVTAAWKMQRLNEPLPPGVCVSLRGRRVFPSSSAWNQPIDREPIDPDSARLIASAGTDGPLHPDFGSLRSSRGTMLREVAYGIPYIVVPGDTPRVPITFGYKEESDPGPYPIPRNAPIEGGANGKGDRHILVINKDTWQLYELWSAQPNADGYGYHAGSGAIFDLKVDKPRPPGWTSADAAGLPIFPGLVRYDEVGEQKVIPHALRFTVRHTRRAYVSPARHWASKNRDTFLPPMGMRVRLKASVDISEFPPQAQVILTALKKYGMILADNGSDWFVSGAPHPNWNDDDLHTLTRIKGSDFEVIKMRNVVTD